MISLVPPPSGEIGESLNRNLSTWPEVVTAFLFHYTWLGTAFIGLPVEWPLASVHVAPHFVVPTHFVVGDKMWRERLHIVNSPCTFCRRRQNVQGRQYVAQQVCIEITDYERVNVNSCRIHDVYIISHDILYHYITTSYISSSPKCSPYTNLNKHGYIINILNILNCDTGFPLSFVDCH